MLKRLLPRSLFGRSLLIIVTPLILLQVISTWIFYDRHWSTIERRLTGAVAGEVAFVMQHLETYRAAPDQAWVVQRAQRDLGLAVTFAPDAILPNAETETPAGYHMLGRAMAERVHRPYAIVPLPNPRELLIRVQIPNGVLDFRVQRERLFSSTTVIFVLWMVGSSLVLFAVASLFMRNQVRPIRRLAAAVDLFGKGRDVPDFHPAGAAEVRLAALAFNRMRERIQRTINQRTEMLAGVSHDLRTPLTRMKLQLAMMPPGNDIAALQEDVAEMEQMVEEYLAFARGESAEAVAETDIGQLVGEAVGQARRSGGAIAYTADGALTVAGRPNALKRCVTNVLSNALRHGERVVVAARRRADTIEITVDDNGPGIPAEFREEVFKPFFRLDSSRSRSTGGTGLGLTIARDILRGHGGDIDLADAPGGGLRVRLWLPL